MVNLILQLLRILTVRQLLPSPRYSEYPRSCPAAVYSVPEWNAEPAAAKEHPLIDEVRYENEDSLLDKIKSRILSLSKRHE